MWLSGVWMRPDTMRPISEAIGPFGLVALDPLVAGLSAHAVAQAELSVREKLCLSLPRPYLTCLSRKPAVAGFLAPPTGRALDFLSVIH